MNPKDKMGGFNTMKVQAIQAACIVETTYMPAVEFMAHYHATLNNSGCHWTFAIRQYLLTLTEKY